MYRSVCFFLIFLMVSNSARAQSLPVSERKWVLPLGRPIQDYRAYTLEEMKVILHIYADYKVWFDLVPVQKRQLEMFVQFVLSQTNQLQLRSQEVLVLKKELKRMSTKWEKENKLRHLAENKPAIGSWIAWGTAAGAFVLAAVLGGILISKD